MNQTFFKYKNPGLFQQRQTNRQQSNHVHHPCNLFKGPLNKKTNVVQLLSHSGITLFHKGLSIILLLSAENSFIQYDLQELQVHK